MYLWSSPTTGQSTEPVKVHVGTAAPAFFQWGAGQYALATRYPDNASMANPSLGAGFVAAKPGDILTLWGTQSNYRGPFR